ncbi:MAG: sulfatase-like hydrolase/transferase [Deltaproteobacteria bacterium]|nr:sulfatase-like hydrolase/transferase [Deltaproteobacteria bacterium]
MSRWLEVATAIGLSIGLAALTAVGIATLRLMLPAWSGTGHALLALVGAVATCWVLLWLARRSVAVGISAAGLILALVLALGARILRGQIVERVTQIDRSAGIDLASAVDPAATGQPGRSSNLVLIVLDTVRADHLSTYGYPRPTSPFFSQLAEQGVLYERAISPAPWTLPAHASLFTGLPPSQHGATSEHKRLDDNAVTLGELLHDAGCETLGLTSNSSASSAHNLHQGFERFYEVFRPDPSVGARAIRRGLPGPLARPLARALPGRPVDRPTRAPMR